MYETGILFWIIPRKNYAKKGKKWQAQGNKGMKKYPISLYVAINLKITRKTPLGVIGNSNNPCYFLNRRVPLPYFFQKKYWSDMETYQKWFFEMFLPYI